MGKEILVTTAVVRRYAEAFDLNYQKVEDEIISTFEDDPCNVYVIGNRVHKLNVHYHTRVPKDLMRDAIAKLLKTEPFDEWIKNGNEEAVKRIAACNGKNYFSFATKYCSFANPDKYPIFDNLSIKALQMFNESKPFYDEKTDFERLRKDIEYGKYREIIDSFREKFGLDEGLNYKNLDKFLWLVGKNI